MTPCSPIDRISEAATPGEPFEPVARRSRFASRIVAALATFGAIAPLGAARSADENLGFEAIDTAGAPLEWRTDGDGGSLVVDDAHAFEGERSLRLQHDGRGRGARAVLELPPPDVIGNRVRVAVHARTESLDGNVSLWLRVEDEQGLLYVDRTERSPRDTAEWTRIELEAPVFPAATRLELALVVSGTGAAWFDALSIEGADTSALPPPAPAAARYLEHALDLIATHSLMRDSIDWRSFRADVLDQARGARVAAETYLALRYALGRLADHHSYLSTPDRAAALELAPVSNARTGRPAVAPEAALLPGGVAYLSVPGFAGGTHLQQVEFAERLQSLIRSYDADAACGWIVDLRENSGGNVWPMLAGMGPLLPDGDAAAAVHPDGRRVPLWYRDGKAGLGEYVQLRVRGEPYRRAQDAPVGVLLGSRTASSGEILAIALHGAANRRSFGAATRGLTTGTRTFALADGASLVLAVAATSARDGRLHTGSIAPDEPLDAASRGRTLMEQDVVTAALAWLRARCERSENAALQ